MDKDLRRIVLFDCEGHRLVGTLNEAPGTTGVLIVSGGNEIRCGAHRGMALLAQRLAMADVPVFRFDRRGIGDSEGTNGGYATSAPDIASALAAFRREQPHIARAIGFGNCDAATALALGGDELDSLVLANPWLGDEDATPPPVAMRAYYARRLLDPSAWRTIFSRGLSFKVSDLRNMLGRPREQPLARQITDALRQRPVTIVLASGDRTAQVFAAAVPVPGAIRIDTASHSFAGHLGDLERVLLAATR
ncbi:hydrolase 1, exosortase A system-associated [Sphingomonas sp.]|uniref:hydrolase 1, exosortase A system-associated n=1 Tax=Sphingomonas sp. TaxID=28214 RepID=UPI0035BC27AE